MGKGTYYHFTDKAGLTQIVTSRKILQSKSGVYGPGVYFLKMSPDVGRKGISEAAWDGVASMRERQGRADYAISVELADEKVEQYENIYVFREDVDLRKTTYKLFSKYGDHKDLE